MTYARPSWATAVKTKFDNLVPTLGDYDKYAAQRDQMGKGVENLPLAGTIRRNLPDLNIPGGEAPKQSPKYDLSYSAKATPGSRTFTAKGSSGGVGSLVQKGEVILRDVGNVLEKTDPSQVIGAIKGTVKETAKSAAREFGGIGLQISNFITDPLFRKAATGQRLTPQEWKEFNTRIAPEYEKRLKQLGYDTLDSQEAFNKQVLSDIYNVSSAIATLAPVAESGFAAATKFSKGMKPLISSMETGFSKTALREALNAGEPLVVDVAGNVFAKGTYKSAVKYVFSEGAKDVLKFSNGIVKPFITEIYKQGMTLELMNEARKYIDPEGALRIERDQRKYVESLSVGERVFLDLAVGLWLPFEVPGLRTTYRTIENAKDTVNLAAASKAIDVAFSDEKSIEILNRISQFNDVKWGNALDIQLKGDLTRHLMTVLEEDNTAMTVDHFLERMKAWANDPSVSYLNKRRDLENIATNLSWYSDKLGRPLTPDEQLMHWFITETQGKYVGDLGEDLTNEFEKALQLRTTGIPAGKEVVQRVIERNEDIKALAGDVIKIGDAPAARTAIDGMLNDKADLLAELRTKLKSLGSDFIIDGEKLYVPNEFKDVPEIKNITENIKLVQESVDGTIAEARAIGIPDQILKAPSNKWIMEVRDAYDRYSTIVSNAESSKQIRGFLNNVSDADIRKLKSFITKNPESRDKILTGELKNFTKIITDSSELRGTVLAADATDDAVLDFLLGLPTKAEASVKIPRDISRVLSRAEKEAFKMNEAVSNFDKYLLEVERKSTEMGIKGEVPFKQAVKEVVGEIRDVEAQLPRGAFAPEFLAKDSRWGAGVTPIPLEPYPTKIPGWAKSFVDFQNTNGINKFLTDYLVPHNPTDIYVKAQNRLADMIEKMAPGKGEALMKEVAKIQDKGISMIPIMPGGGPKWEALGKPMVSGVDWKTLDDLGNRFGVTGFGKMTRESFINSIAESGVKPGIVDRLRAAPGIGSIFDALYRQYMLTRFAVNPFFHAQQVPEVGILGVLRSFNLPKEMSEKYIKSATRFPVSQLDEAETLLYDAVYGSKLAKDVNAAEAGIEAIGDTRGMSDILRGTRLEERKRLAAFMAEFPVQVRGQLFDMPILKNVDPLATEEYRSFILNLQDNPKEMARVIDEAFSTKGFDPKLEAVRRAMKTTQTEVQKLVSYNLNRSALEKDIHAILFPFSYTKKFWTEVGKATFGGSVARVEVAGDIAQGIEDMNDSPGMLEVRAKYPTMTGWIWGLSPVNPTYPLVNMKQLSFGFGGLRASPVQAVLYDSFVDPDGKYNLGVNADDASIKLGGGGASFYFKDIDNPYRKGLPGEWGAFLSEIFKADSPEQQKKYIYTLNRLQLEARLKNPK